MDNLNDLELQALERVTNFNNALNALRATPGFNVYMEEVDRMKKGILDSFGLIQGKTVEEVGMKTIALQAQLGFIDSLFKLTSKGYDEPQRATGQD